jgi:lysyl-tRNA synthetase class 1
MKGAAGKGLCAVRNRLWPVGLPHIGTFGEVLRTTMIRRAFERDLGHSRRG